MIEPKGYVTYFFTIYTYKTNPRENEKAIYFDGEGGKVRVSRLKEDGNVRNQIEQYIAEVNPDIIHVHNFFRFPWDILHSLEKFKEIPVVFTSHDAQLMCLNGKLIRERPKNYVCGGGIGSKCITSGCTQTLGMLGGVLTQKKLVKALKERISRIACPSKAYYDRYLALGFNGARHVPSFVDRDEKNPIQYIQDTVFHVLFMGTFKPEKGITPLINAIKIVHDKGKNVILHLAGDGEIKEKLIDLTRQLGIEKSVKFEGFVEGDKKDELYKTSNVVIEPSMWVENFPFAVQEAMWYGRAVIGTRIGGIAELIRDGKEGLLFDSIGDQDQIADLILKLIENDGMAERMGRAAHERIVSLNLKSGHVEKLIEIYEELSRTKAR